MEKRLRQLTAETSPALISLVAACLVGAGVTLFTASAVQQNYRQGANDPQIQLAQDAAAQLNAGSTPEQVAPGTSAVDMHDSLAPFFVIIDRENHLLAASGKLDGRQVQPPAGSLTSGHRFTWQPRSDTRLAAVVEPYYDGYVIASRNLREVENREGQLRLITLLTLLGITAVGAAGWWALTAKYR